jgi:hypothetical protein
MTSFSISRHDAKTVATAATPRLNNMALLASARPVQWNGAKHQEAVDILRGEGKMIVTPTKVGYIIVVSDFAGLQRKFKAKQRNALRQTRCGSLRLYWPTERVGRTQ